MTKKKLFAIIGSTRNHSSSKNIVEHIAKFAKGDFETIVFDQIDQLPHFNPDLDHSDPPIMVDQFRSAISSADVVLICTPEYVFSLPGSLKNAIEWCVSTTVFAQKPTGLIVAAAAGEKATEELQLVMHTLDAKLTPATTMLIKGAKGKLNSFGEMIDQQLKIDLLQFANSLVRISS